MSATDVKITSLTLFYLPIKARVPLRFGFGSMTDIECVRTRVEVESDRGKNYFGWGEVPLNMQWFWPADCPVEDRLLYMKQAISKCADLLLSSGLKGHPLDIGFHVIEEFLPKLVKEVNEELEVDDPFPWSAALAAYSVFDLALYDAYAKANARPVYALFNSDYLSYDLSYYLQNYDDQHHLFRDLYPADFLRAQPLQRMPVWHLVGGNDILYPEEVHDELLNDGYPVLLPDWIKRDGLTCLKIKLLGRDFEWDVQRVVQVGKIALQHEVVWLSVDFNCTVNDPAYVVELLLKLMREYPKIFGMLLFVEQPFPAHIELLRLDVHSVSSLKPLFLDEGATHWSVVEMAVRLGWNGVVLKTCKSYTASILMACLAQRYGMQLMVQDLTNPMLAALSHISLAAVVPTIMGLEMNACQYYPGASEPEAEVHHGVFTRKNGTVSTESLSGAGFGYRIEEIKRVLPEPAYTKEAIGKI